MKTEYIIFIITAFLIANTYYDGKFLKTLQSSQKYVKMATFAFIGLSIYLFAKKKSRPVAIDVYARQRHYKVYAS
jgi:hypothetical protein